MPMSRCSASTAQIVLPAVTYAAASAAEPLRYQGVWRSGQDYEAGQFVTHKGALWHADSSTSEKPGGPNTGWTLAVKSGQRP